MPLVQDNEKIAIKSTKQKIKAKPACVGTTDSAPQVLLSAPVDSTPPESAPANSKTAGSKRRKMDADDEASDKRIRPKEFTDADEIRIVENLIDKSSNNALDVNGSGIAEPNSKDETYLHVAADLCDADAIRWLLSKGAAVDPRDGTGATPLARCVAECAKCADILIQAGADVNQEDDEGVTPLHRAVLCPDSTLLLLNSEALVNVFARSSGVAPLHDACYGGNMDCIRALVEHGASVDLTIAHTKNAGATPLHYAAQQNHEKVVAYLLDKGADPNRVDGKGCAALHYAAYMGATRTIEALLRSGAEPSLKDKEGRTPLDLARLRKHTVAAKLISRAGRPAPVPQPPPPRSFGSSILSALSGVAGIFAPRRR